MHAKRFVVLMAAAALLVAGCSGNNNGSGSSTTQPSSPTTTTAVSPAPSTTTQTTPAATPTAKPSSTAVPCAKTSWNTAVQQVSLGQLVTGPITRAGVTWEKCFDRFTVTLKGTAAPGYRAEYVNQVTMDGSGAPVVLRGRAFLQLIVAAPTAGTVVIGPSSGKMIQQVRFAGSFEGQTTFGVGLDTKRPFAVRVLPGSGSTTRVMVSFAR